MLLSGALDVIQEGEMVGKADKRGGALVVEAAGNPSSTKECFLIVRESSVGMFDR